MLGQLPLYAVSSTFTPASLALTGWWRSPYTSSPWVGTSSKGTSGNFNLSEATNPPSNSALGGTIPSNIGPFASYDGVNDVLSTSALSNFVANQCGGWALFFATAALTDPGAGSRYLAPQFFTDANAIVNIGFTTSGCHANVFTAASVSKEIVIPASINTLNLVQWRITALNTVDLSVNGSAFLSTSLGGSVLNASRTGVVRVGTRFDGVTPFTGIILETGVINTDTSDDFHHLIRQYINFRYNQNFST